MKNQANVVICPPCGEQSLAPEGFNPGVARATKEGQHRNKTLWPLLPRLTAVLPPQGREMYRGFTLIELLVVVLIVGILAAVAVPQYNRAVEKTRLVQLRVRLDALYKSAQLYELANGQWPSDVRELDLDVTSAAQEITQSELTTSSHHAAKYDEDSWCGVHVSPSGNRSAWCQNKHVRFSIIKDTYKCTGRTDLGEKLCAGEK